MCARGVELVWASSDATSHSYYYSRRIARFAIGAVLMRKKVVSRTDSSTEGTLPYLHISCSSSIPWSKPPVPYISRTSSPNTGLFSNACLSIDRPRYIPQLKSDVFSISFLPPAAPGAGHVIICGLRDGSVILLDSREKPPQHQRPSTDGDNTSAGGSCGKNGGRGSRTLSHNRARGKKGSHHQQERNHLARMSSSVDHTHVLQDGTRCLARDRLGSLQTLDLRFPGRAGPLKVLVSPPATGALRARDRGKFALDPGEAVVATPVVASASTAVSEGGGVLMGGGERFLSSPRAWDAFSNAEIDRRGVVVDFHRCGSTGAAGGGVGGGGEGADTTTATTTAAAAGDDRRRLTGDRLQILSLSTGEVLTDIATPWTEMSLARGVVGPPGGGAGGCHGELQFWGKACESGQRTVVFEARLRSEGCGGFGRG